MKFCYAYDPQTKIAYFIDGKGHLTWYGRYKLYEPVKEYVKMALEKLEEQKPWSISIKASIVELDNENATFDEKSFANMWSKIC